MQEHAYDEIVDFIASGTTPGDIISFRPSDKAKERVAYLINKEKLGGLASDEEQELNQYEQLEHIMRLTKAKARQFNTSQ